MNFPWRWKTLSPSSPQDKLDKKNFSCSPSPSSDSVEKTATTNEQVFLRYLTLLWKGTYREATISLYSNMAISLEWLSQMINWHRNRPPDPVRVQQLSLYYETSGIEMIPGILYLWKWKGKSTDDTSVTNYYVYDGIHRVEALKHSLQSGSSIGKRMACIVYILDTNDESLVTEHFQDLNKNIPVPSLYFGPHHPLKKKVCESVVQRLCETYPMFCSSSRHPAWYNFNRDQVLDLLSQLSLPFDQHQIHEKLYQLFMTLNEMAYQKVKESHQPFPKKCERYHFFLFYLDFSVIRSFLETHCC